MTTEALLVANTIRLTTAAAVACVLWQVPLPGDLMSPTQAQYAQSWLSHAAEVGVLTYACAGLAVGDGDSVFARLPRTLFNVGTHDQRTVWRGNAVVTLGLYLAWLLNSGCLPLHGVLGVLGTILFHAWWPIVQALCGTFFAIMYVTVQQPLLAESQCAALSCFTCVQYASVFTGWGCNALVGEGVLFGRHESLTVAFEPNHPVHCGPGAAQAA